MVLETLTGKTAITAAIERFTGDSTVLRDTSAVIITQECVASGTITARDAVYVTGVVGSKSQVAKATATTAAICFSTLGFALQTVASGDNVTIQKAGCLVGFTGLITGDPYYLSESVAGEIIRTDPSTLVKPVGVAVKTDTLDINVERHTEI